MKPDELDRTVQQINAQLASEGREPFRFKTLPQGAATSIWAAFAAAADEIGGRYCKDCQVSEDH